MFLSKHDAVKSAIFICVALPLAGVSPLPLPALALEPASAPLPGAAPVHDANPAQINPAQINAGQINSTHANPTQANPVQATTAPPVSVQPGLTAAYIGSKLDALTFTGWDLVKQSIWQRDSADAKSPLSSYFYGDETKSRIISEYKVNIFARKTIGRGQRTIYIDVYQFDQNAGALAAYYYLRKGATTVIKRGDVSSEEDDSISFCHGTNFVSIYGTSEDDDESKDVIRKCADALSRLSTTAGAKPEVMRQLPVLDLIAGSEKLVAGPVSARRFCPAPYLPALVGEGNEIVWGCVADYQIQAPFKERLKLLITEYPTIEAAQAHYAAYMAELSSGHGETPATRLAGSANVFKLAATYIAVDLRGKTICLVTGAKKRFSPQLLLQQMRY